MEPSPSPRSCYLSPHVVTIVAHTSSITAMPDDLRYVCRRHYVFCRLIAFLRSVGSGRTRPLDTTRRVATPCFQGYLKPLVSFQLVVPPEGSIRMLAVVF